ncbi:hypothetical protein [Mycolicibacterium palauense]|uniref:hypothetical protein n=1 Tax=Mycolicibacterium palauense TaxID=2034511 RepID=UPI000BFF0061|nr:hypothetical protein [Mycolicibacterium palauense]
MTTRIFERPFVVIRDTAELYGWTVGEVDHGIGHASHVLERGESTVVVSYRAGLAMSSTYSGPQALQIQDKLVPPVVDRVIDRLKADGVPPDTACVAWREWSGSHWQDRVTDPLPYPEAVEFDQFCRAQQVLTVTDVRLTPGQQTPATTQQTPSPSD